MRTKARYRFLLVGVALLIGVWLLRDPLRHWIARTATLANPSPPPELVAELIEQSPDPVAAILAAWNTGKIVHRQVAIRVISHAVPADQPLPRELESLVLGGALDGDMNVREAALVILHERNHPALPSLAAAQLQDCDPEIRLLGLNYLKPAGASIGIPTVASLLDEDDPLIVTTGLKLLENWSGESFGVRLSDAAPRENEQTGLKEFPEGSRAKARAGAARAKAWWAEHQTEFPAVQIVVPRAAITARKAGPAGDFALHSLDGRLVRLTDFRGQVVLMNFWTTWCNACVSEMPELIALQKRHGDRLAILGVSLDFVPDSHGHVGGHPAVEEQVRQEVGRDHSDNQAALKQVREKVARTVKARGINYTILLDERNEVGGRFNGGELPTTVIVDAQGNVRRRFVGARSLPVFEAMIAEASQPAQE